MCTKIADIVIGDNRTAQESGNYGYKKKVSKESYYILKFIFTLNISKYSTVVS